MASKLKLFGKETEKSMEYIANQLKRLQREIKIASRSIKEQDEANTLLKKHFQELNKEHSILSDEVRITSNKLTESMKQLEKATSEIQTFKPSVEKKLINQITNKFEIELANATNKIQAEVSGFNNAKEVFSKHLDQSREVSEAMKKLQEVVKKLDAKDFALESYAKQLEKNDREKLKLMKRIDSLENMLAKMKRNK